MMNRIIALALIAAGVTGGYGLYRLGINQGMKNAVSAHEQQSASTKPAPHRAEAVRKPLYWQDPMNPGQKFDKPGKSPFMDMDLVPVYGNDNTDVVDNPSNAGEASISPGVQQNLGIRTAEVSKGKLASGLTAVGSVTYNERDVALVQARSNGYVERLYARAPFDPVRKGQPLAELYVPDWVAAQEEYLTAKRMQGSDMSSIVDGARQRMRLAGMDDQQIRLVESSGKVNPRVTINAPIGGILAELPVREGMTVATGAPMFRINGLSTVWVNVEIPEALAAQVRPGNAVEARTLSLPATVFKGKVSAILPEVNATTRTLKARVELDNPHGELVPGMFATVNLSAAQRSDVLLVPSEAVIQTGTRSVVMVALAGGGFKPVEVEIGGEANSQTEIRKGLEVGQKVVVSGQFLIDSEASLKETATRMYDAPPANAQGAMK